MEEPNLMIVSVDLKNEGIIVDFSDGTTCLYMAEELRTIDPEWKLVQPKKSVGLHTGQRCAETRQITGQSSQRMCLGAD